jgi:hypothetical protein
METNTKKMINDNLAENNKTSWYIQNPIYPTQSSNITIGGSMTQLFFNIPTNVFGIDKTQIAWDAEVLGTTAVNVVGLLGKKLTLFDYIYQIVIYDQSTGFIIQDIRNVDTLTKMQQLYVNPLKNRDYTRGFLCKSDIRVVNTVNTCTTSDPYFQLNPANGAHLNTIAKGLAGAAGACALNNDYKANMVYGGVVNNAQATIQLPSVLDELNNIIHDSFFSLKKDIYLQNIVIKIVLNSINKIITQLDAITDASNAVDFVGPALTLNNFRLIMYMQGDNLLNSAIRENALLGTNQFIIPEIVDNMVTFSATQYNTLNITFASKFNRSKLYKYYHFICATMAGQTCSNFSPIGNWSQVDVYFQNIKVKSVYNNAATTSSDFYGGFKDILRQYDTDNYQNPGDFNNDSFISTVFDSEKVDCKDLKEWNNGKWTGIEFAGSQSLQFKCNVTNFAKTHYVYVVLSSLLFQTNGVFHA